MDECSVEDFFEPQLAGAHQGAGHGPADSRIPSVHEDRKCQVRPPALQKTRVATERLYHLSAIHSDEGLVNEVHVSHDR